MAGAEVRAAWQRAANRCFVQEDAKRAPKLACCQSSSSTSKQIDAETTDTVDGPDHPALGRMPFNRNSSLSSLPPDTSWWHYSDRYQKGLISEQVNELEPKVETSSAGTVNSPGETILLGDHKNCESSLDMKSDHCEFCLNKALEARKQEVKASYRKKAEEYLELMDMNEYELMHMDPEWLGVDKPQPWWRTADEGELASLVMKKSLDHIENCDLPAPRQVYIRTHPGAHIGSFDNGNALAHEEWCLLYGSEDSFSAKDVDRSETPLGSDKAQLMEALHNSQTRARQAEKRAKEVCSEKEHILELFVRQAAQLLAYKQCFQLRQLETIYLQNKNNDTTVLPRIPFRGRKRQKSCRGKRARYDITKYAVTFALGLSLVSAGLLVGWTVGWMLPTF